MLGSCGVLMRKATWRTSCGLNVGGGGSADVVVVFFVVVAVDRLIGGGATSQFNDVDRSGGRATKSTI